ncbi:MAG TPA: hypothetical protein VGR11_14780, partial [Solirubrobacteraceae bacterium]|nr:hypothetical protein [Solirubrobacteraceae bacterium]
GCGGDGEGEGAEREDLSGARTAGVPPPGEGVDDDEAVPIGGTIHLDGIAYTPQITRQLNPHVKPDEALIGDRRAGRDRLWLGAFIRVCNEDDRVRVPSDRLALVGAFGQRFSPTELPAGNPFDYDPEPLPPDRCLPEPGSVDDRVIEGALVLFNIPVEFFSERPVALEVTSDSGERERVIVDL